MELSRNLDDIELELKIKIRLDRIGRAYYIWSAAVLGSIISWIVSLPEIMNIPWPHWLIYFIFILLIYVMLLVIFGYYFGGKYDQLEKDLEKLIKEKKV